MNTIKSILFGLLLVATLSSYAQQKEVKPRTFKYGKIELSEFDTKVNGSDSAASAIALFDVGKGWFEFSAKTGEFIYVFERHMRYKIINKTGYDYANLEIQLYESNGNKENLEYMDGATYNLEAGKTVISKLNKESKFSEKQDKNFTLKKFALPNVKEGSIVEFKYKIKSDFIFTLRSWYFQKEIPVLYSSYEIRIPEYYKYKITAGGYLFINPKEELINETFMSGTNTLNAKSLKLNYQVENVPGLKTENFITTMKDYVSRVGFELSSITVPGAVYRDVTSTWPKIVKRLKEDENFGLFANRRSFSKTLLKEIIKTNTDKDTVLSLVFNYVKNNIKFNNEVEKYTSETNPKSIFEKKAGNSADINLCLLTLLTEAKIDAFPVLLSTRSHGAHPGFPMLTEFNNVIIVAQIGEKSILLDATDKNHTPNMIGFDNLCHEGLKVNFADETADWISVEDPTISRKSVNYVLNLDTENKITGKMYLASTNYEALDRRESYLSAANETDFLKNYKDGKPGFGIKNYKIENLTNINESLVETMDISIDDNVEEAGNLIYFTPLFYERTKENPFKLEERNFPVDFGHPTEKSIRITLDYPKEYQIDKVPKNEKIILPEESAAFTFMFANEPGKLVISSKISFKKSLYTPEEYHHLKELFKNIVRKQSEQIVLKKS
ncbi:DUF3857 domain-containing protein [Pedobacter sp. B4-66]|uniref:DUF3857 domain-containing protein n=1 Tax=Pedobacter sp. B4-66 TaxID=2817280 RepID=UPI001BD9CBD0|nr:DUF3857 domain-containing protein [Pedobacter sp. B4-66]